MSAIIIPIRAYNSGWKPCGSADLIPISYREWPAGEEVLYATDSDCATATRAGLPPWSVVWFLDTHHNGHAL